MAPTPKLTDTQVKAIRRRIGKGEQRIDLPLEFGVDRKTIYRRVGELERDEMEEAERVAVKRRRNQARRERGKLLDRENANAVPPPLAERRPVKRAAPNPSGRLSDDYASWLDTLKNLSNRGLVNSWGGIRLCNPEGTVQKWVKRQDVDALIDEGWTLA